LIKDSRCCIIRYNTSESKSVFVGLSFKTREKLRGRSDPFVKAHNGGGGGMDGIKTIDELIKAKKLTPEEQEKLREIIEECRIRETQIQEASDATQQNLEILSRSFGLIVSTVSDVGKAVDELYEEVGRLQLKMMPETQFFRE
jgi:polyhydroxyalkanoate synthesis regulator phasin